MGVPLAPSAFSELQELSKQYDVPLPLIMNIWFSQIPEQLQSVSNHQFGEFLIDVTKTPQNQKSSHLIQIGNIAEIPSSITGMKNWYIPVGLGGHLSLLKALKETDCPIFVVVNGLGQQTISLMRDLLKNIELILVFESFHIPENTFIEQLIWLQTQPEPFAVRSENEQQLTIATALQAHSLIISEPQNIDINELLYLSSLSQNGVPRPISQEEVDHVKGKEVCLSVSHPLQKGEQLQDQDITVEVTPTPGLAPSLQEHIIGKTLRYSIAPGEALTFGHLEGSFHAG